MAITWKNVWRALTWGGGNERVWAMSECGARAVGECCGIQKDEFGKHGNQDS